MEFLKKRKNTAKVDVSTVEQSNEIRVIRGTCPIDLEGHWWLRSSKSLWTREKRSSQQTSRCYGSFQKSLLQSLVLENEGILSLFLRVSFARVVIEKYLFSASQRVEF